MLVGDVTAELGLDPSGFESVLATVKTQLAALVAKPYIVQVAAVGGAGRGAGTAVAGAAALGLPRTAAQARSRLLGPNGEPMTQYLAGQKAVTASAGKVGSAMDTTAQKTQGASSALKDASTSAKHSETSFNTLSRTLVKASFVFGGIMVLKAAIQGVGQAIAYTIGEAARFEQVQIGFRQLYGGVEKAKSMLGELAAFASRTPFELVNTEQQALRLKAYGFAAKQVIPILTDVGDAASALGTGQEGINRITLAMGQMRSAGRMNSRDMLQLTEAFVPAWDYVAKAFNTSTGQVRKWTEKGLVPANQALAAIRAGMRRDFGGMMQAQMETLIGQWSNFKDRVALAARAVGKDLLPMFKQWVAIAVQKMPEVQAVLVATFKGTNDLGRAFKNIKEGFVTVWPVIKRVGTELLAIVSIVTGALAGNWKSVWSTMKKHPAAMVLTILGVISTVGKLILAIEGIAAAWNVAAFTSAAASATTSVTGVTGAVTGLRAGLLGLPTIIPIAVTLTVTLLGTKAALDILNGREPQISGTTVTPKTPAGVADKWRSTETVMPNTKGSLWNPEVASSLRTSVFDKWKKHTPTYPQPTPKPEAFPSFAAPGGGAKKGGGADKAASAAEKLRDALAAAVKSAQDLAEKFRNAAREIANFTGLFERPEKRRVGGFMGAARAQVRKLERYYSALKTLQKKLPGNVFDEVVASGTASMDEVIKLARMSNVKQWAGIIQQREAVSKRIASITMSDELAAGRKDIISTTTKAAREAGSSIVVNMGGIVIHSVKNPEQFAKDITRLVERELRSAGLAGAY